MVVHAAHINIGQPGTNGDNPGRILDLSAESEPTVPSLAVPELVIDHAIDAPNVDVTKTVTHGDGGGLTTQSEALIVMQDPARFGGIPSLAVPPLLPESSTDAAGIQIVKPRV